MKCAHVHSNAADSSEGGPSVARGDITYMLVCCVYIHILQYTHVYIRILYIIYKPWCGLCVLVIYIDMFMTSPEMGMRAPSIHI